MNDTDALAAKQVYEEMRAAFDQLSAIRRMMDDCSGRLKQTNDFEKRNDLDREFNQLQREWDLVHNKFLTLNQRLNILVSRFVSDLSNPKLALSVAVETLINARRRNGIPQH
jgi:hypothetical protein